MTTEAAIRTIVSEIMQSRFADHGLVKSDVVFDEDFDGDKIVRILAHFAHRPEDRADTLLDAADAIRARLIEDGDDRFVFVSRDYPRASDDKGEEEEEEERSRRG